MTKKTFFWPIRVYYDATDAAGVVYHSHYLNYMEQARTEWLRHFGFEQHRLYRELGTLFAVTWMEVRFLAPARLDDRLTVTVTLQECKQASLTVQQNIVRDEEQRQLIDAKVRIAALSSQFKPIRLPAELLQQLQ
ncbi:tol-pal system-associated acyl-CoA thioesterase [Candidatus Magnetaquicoccus inordinatus]|uniref:tol-pal system-associated acyl-CoA thioesterase n=1 Tax=Candidatus Magnetaquicoccus inordinatus TaxID=2496818 RepID=UPI001D0E647A|nr:tol-pal system-associated acyl-CoA thioesterase [Candidatus Magnetaquicoccus inordinatus]